MRRCSAMLFFLAFLLVMAAAVQHATASPITRHDRNVIRFFHNHPKLAATPAGASVLANVLPHVVRALAAADAWPEHHALWLCINDNEAKDNWSAINPNGHYGGLQMHAGWGYGTSYHASDDSQLVQEQAAERAYAASGYSRSFLVGQWFAWDGAYYCLAYA